MLQRVRIVERDRVFSRFWDVPFFALALQIQRLSVGCCCDYAQYRNEAGADEGSQLIFLRYTTMPLLGLVVLK